MSSMKRGVVDARGRACVHGRRKLTRVPTIEEGAASAALVEAACRPLSATSLLNGAWLGEVAAENVETFARHAPQRPPAGQGLSLTWGSLCSGSEGCFFALEAAEKAWQDRGVSVVLKHRFACEVAEDKRAWIRHVLRCGRAAEQAKGPGPQAASATAAESGPQAAAPLDRESCIFVDIQDMGAPCAWCALHAKKCEVPEIDLLIVGTSCKDMSKANIHFTRNLHVLRSSSSRGGSAQTFRSFMDFVSAKCPGVIIFENVDSMDTQTNAGGQGPGGNNLDILLSELAGRGYESQVSVVDSSTFGLPARRRRLYVTSLRTGHPKLDFSTRGTAVVFQTFVRLLGCCCRQAPSATDVLLASDDPAVEAELQARMAIRTAQEATGRVVHGQAQRWTEQHMEEASRLGVRWRTSPPACLTASPWFQTLTAREQDGLQLAMRRDPRQAFFDVSQSVGRIITHTLPQGEDGRVQAPTVMPHALLWFNATHSLVRAEAAGLVGEEQVAIGQVDFTSRLVLGRESLAWQGFPVRRVLETLPRDAVFSEGLMQDLAGNMMSLPVVLGILQAIVCAVTWKPGASQELSTTEEPSCLRLCMTVCVCGAMGQ